MGLIEVKFNSKSKSRRVYEAIELGTRHDTKYQGEICTVKFMDMADSDLMQVLSLVKQLSGTHVYWNGKELSQPQDLLFYNKLPSQQVLALKKIEQDNNITICLNLRHSDLFHYEQNLATVKDGNIIQLILFRISSLSESFSAFKGLQTLYLLKTYNLLKLPDSFGELPSLQRFSINSLGFRDYPMNAPWTINKEAGKLTALPESFGQLQNLENLDLYGSGLLTLPESFGTLRNLQVAYLEGNQLHTLPDSFGELSRLQQLSLKGNQLSALPESFGKLESLEKLDLSGNKLATLPESFGLLKSLTTLDLSHNHFQKLSGVFARLRNLHDLNLVDNQLKRLPDPFAPYYQTLQLKGNPLDEASLRRARAKDVAICDKCSFLVTKENVISVEHYWKSFSDGFHACPKCGSQTSVGGHIPPERQIAIWYVCLYCGNNYCDEGVDSVRCPRCGKEWSTSLSFYLKEQSHPPVKSSAVDAVQKD